MKRLFVTCFALLAVGCGSSTDSVSHAPQPAPTVQPPIGRLATYLLAANSTGTNGVVVFRVDGSGSLQQVSSTPTQAGVISLEAHPTQPFIYAGGFSSDVLGFRLDLTSGQLSTLPGFPLSIDSESNVMLDQTGNYLYSLGDKAIDGFRVNQADGSLTRLPNFPIQGLGELFNGEFDRDNHFLYAADRGLDVVLSYRFDAATGALTEVARVSAQDPTAIEIDPSNRFLYTSVADGQLNGYARNNDGTLTQLSGLPVSYAPAGALTARFDFSGQTLFIGDRTSRTLNAFTIGSGGQLSAVTGFPRSGGGGDVVTYPLPSPYLYAADRVASLINGFAIGSGVVLTPTPGSPYAPGGGSNELLPVVRAF